MPDSSGKWTSQDAIQAITYWSRKYGYSDAFLQAALAIAYGESGMNPYAHGDVNIGGSYGIYQFYTNGGRGTGVPIETLYNPWYQAEKNLPILYATFQKFGGDSGWYNNPAYVLKNTWKYGQGSIWPSDYQLSSSINSMRTLWKQQPDLFSPDAKLPEPPPGNWPTSDPNTTTTTDPSSTSPTAPVAYPLAFTNPFQFSPSPASSYLGNFFGGSGGMLPATSYLSGLLSGYNSSPGGEFLANIMGGSSAGQMEPALDYIRGLTGDLFSF